MFNGFESYKLLLKDVLLYLASKALPGVAGLVAVVLFVRVAGDQIYGRYALLFVVSNSVSVFAIGWLNQAQLRFYSKYADSESQFALAVRGALVLAVAATWSIVFIVVVLRDGFHVPYSGLDLVCAGLAATALFTYTTKTSAFQAKLQPLSVARMEGSRAVLMIAAPLLLLLMYGKHHLSLLGGTAAAYLLASVPFRPWRSPLVSAGARCRVLLGNRGLLRLFWSYGWPMSLWMSCMSFFPVVDRYLIQHFYGFGVTGQYASTFDLVVRGYTLYLFPITLAAHPRIMKAANSGNTSEAWSLIGSALLIQTLLFVPVGLVVFLLGQDILMIALGFSSPETGRLLFPLALGGLVWQMALIVHKVLEVRHNTLFMLVAIVTSLGTSTGLNFVLLPRIGVQAAAYSYLGAGLTYVALCALKGISIAQTRAPAQETDVLENNALTSE